MFTVIISCEGSIPSVYLPIYSFHSSIHPSIHPTFTKQTNKLIDFFIIFCLLSYIKNSIHSFIHPQSVPQSTHLLTTPFIHLISQSLLHYQATHRPGTIMDALDGIHVPCTAARQDSGTRERERETGGRQTKTQSTTGKN